MNFKASWWLGFSSRSALVCAVVGASATSVACGGGGTTPTGSNGTGGTGGSASTSTSSTNPTTTSSTTSGSGGAGGGMNPAACEGVDCSGHGKCTASGNSPVCTCDPGYVASGPTTCMASDTPTLGGCPVLPSDNIFNTPIDALPVHPLSAQFLSTIGAKKVHLDLGATVDPASDSYYGIPYNVVHAKAMTWAHVQYVEAPLDETDCVDASSGAQHTEVSPCLATAATQPVFPVPAVPLIEGGISTDMTVYGDHHLMMLDADSCTLYEIYHAYAHPGDSTWDIGGSAIFDLASNKLRPDSWTSVDAAGFPLLPLILKGDEATAGAIKHALRFTIGTKKIRDEYVWPARHTSHNGTKDMALPPMGQLFRLKASYAIPAAYGAQSKAILQALKTYGMYLADGGSDLFISGDPNTKWTDAVFSEVQTVTTSDFEAVDLTPIHNKPGFDINSGAVPK
jgi:hypothetical protein